MRKYLLLAAFVTLISCCFAGGAAADSVPTPIKIDKISIMSYNIKMLPRGGNSFLHHHPVTRARIIPKKLMEESPDVIVFEEAFDGLAVRILKKKLKAMYPYVMGTHNRKVISYKRAGGVLMFSKYPMKELESIRYSECKGVDCMGNKGAMLVEVQHPVHKFQLFGTHMQAGGSKELKISQYEEAGALLKRHEQPGVPQFAAGDFNTHKADTLLYPKLLAALKAEDGEISSELKFTSDHLLNDMDSYNPNRRNLIDFVFFKGNGVTPVSTSRFVKQIRERWSVKHKDLSDHNAVMLEMKL
jgi:endonuclease/exonuclease/phosphatase family metal-dependent hydrolase